MTTTTTARAYHCPDWCEVTQEQHYTETEQHLERVRLALRALGSDETASSVLLDEPDPIAHRVTLDAEDGRWTVGFDAYENSDGTIDPAGPDIYIQEDSTLTCDEMERISVAVAELSRRLRALGAS